jgi:hypothetical protein
MDDLATLIEEYRQAEKICADRRAQLLRLLTPAGLDAVKATNGPARVWVRTPGHPNSATHRELVLAMDGPIDAKRVATAAGTTPATARAVLRRCCDDGDIRRTGRGQYEVVKKSRAGKNSRRG